MATALTSTLDATLTSSIDLQTDELPTCVRCKEDITTGHAYELGDDKWHTDCFSCYRCDKPLSCESDFLVLGTGTLICFDCSDSCKSCGKKIDDLAIILSSSNEAYCSDCFKCCKCGNQIKDLRYAKTKRGLFCLSCHERLLAKRKHYEEKKRRLKKHLPTVPGSTVDDELLGLQNTDPLNPPGSPSALHIADYSINRPLSPVRNSKYLDRDISLHPNGSDNNVVGDQRETNQRKDITLDNLFTSPFDEEDNSSMDNLSMEPLENLENEGIIDSTHVPPHPHIHTPSYGSQPKAMGLFAEALNSPVSINNDLYENYGSVDATKSKDKFSRPKPFSPKIPYGSHNRNNERNGSKDSIYSLPVSESSIDINGLGGITPKSTDDLRSGSNTPYHPSGRGRSDGNIFVKKEERSTNIYGVPTPKDRARSKNYSNIESVHMYRTPTVDEEMTRNEQQANSNMLNSTDLLTSLETDIEQLQNSKQKLLKDIDSIQSDKDSLLREVESLRNEKISLKTFSSTESHVKHVVEAQVIYDDQSPTKGANIASIARTGRPKFWKFFSSTSPPKQGGLLQKSGSSRGISNLVGSNKFDLSDPLLGKEYNSDSRLKPFSSAISGNSRSNSSQSISIQAGNINNNGESLYGSTLVKRCSYENASIPHILTSCMQFIELDDENLKTEGIYRKSGSHLTIEQVEKYFAKNTNINLSDYDIHIAASILKRYLRKLPEPVITFQVYDPLIDLVRSNNMTIESPISKDIEPSESQLEPVRLILQQLPQEHIELLKILSAHIRKIVDYKDWNLMNLNNLALVFAPGLIRDLSGEKDIFDMKERNYIIGFIFENYKLLFN